MAASAVYGAWLLLGLLTGQSVLAPSVLAQEARRLPPQEVPLRPFATEAQAHRWLMRQAENGIEIIRRAARARGCTPAAEPRPDELRCRSQALRSVVLREVSRRQLVLVDSAMAPLRSGSGVQLAGDAMYVMREGELVRVAVSGDRAVAGDVQQTRLAPAEWTDDSDDELITWGNLVVTLNRGQRRHAVLRTYAANASGRLEPRDTLVVTGDAPQGLHHVASRVRDHELLLYTTWPVLNDFDESAWLSSIAPALPDGEPVLVRPRAWFRQVYRPVSGVDTTEALNHVHALVRCDLRAAPLTCDADMVMAGEARQHAFTERALEIETDVQRGALHVHLPYAGSAPRAFMGLGDSSSHVVRHAGPYRITTTRTFAPRRNDTSTSIVDSVTIVRPGTSTVWRVTLPHHVERAVALGSRLLLVGPTIGEVRATLVRLGSRAEVVATLRLPDAGGAPDGAVLTAHRVASGRGDHFRVGYTVVDYTIDTLTNPGDDYDAAWFFEVRADSLASLGLLRATAGTFSDTADVHTNRMPLGASHAVLRGDRAYAIFHRELVEGRVVNGRVREVARGALVPE